MDEQLEQQAAAQETTELESGGLLDQAISATKQTSREEAESMIRSLVAQANSGTVSYDRNVISTIQRGIAQIDSVVSKQLAAVMHHEKFQSLEGSWRGLHYLVHESETGEMLKIRLLNCAKKELGKELEKAPEFDQSSIWKAIYENEFGMPGGEPYGLLVGDYQFDHKTPGDMDVLEGMSGIAAASFAPFITSPSSKLFGLESWEQLPTIRDLKTSFDAKEYVKWKSFRDSDDSRYVVMAMPRTLARLPYGSQTKPVEEFDFEEVDTGPNGEPIAISHDNYCWMNTAYVLAGRMTAAFSETNWCTAIRGANSGGKVEGLPTHVVRSPDGDTDIKCPTEVAITDRREKELSDLGFLSLCHYKNTDYSVFFGGQTVQKPKIYDLDAATANAAISARLPYIMASSRIAHYLKVIARDIVGSFKEAEDVQAFLERWIKRYTSADDKPSEETKARYPLRQSQIEVREIPGKPGSYNAIAHLRPWLQMEELSASIRMVASLPKKA
ncbi:MAG: type VI secretion system contractile sheath large subunit [Planctomycetales bacterium]|nr:type VI secretion system contractile sheath large subunit [Planctomycetales bacterium]